MIPQHVGQKNAFYAILLIGMLLAPSIVSAVEVSLEWTAPGDNGNEGTASLYDLRYDNSAVGADTLSWWNSAVQFQSEPLPSPAGSDETVLIAGLTPGETYYFMILSTDDSSNTSPWSNILTYAVPDTTPDPPLEISSITVDNWMTDSIRVRWNTNLASAGFLRYGESSSYGSSTDTGASGTEHTAWIAELEENSLIHFQVVSFSATKRDSSTDATVRVPNLAPLPPEVLQSNPDSTGVTLIWTPNMEPDRSGYRVFWLGAGREETPLVLTENFDTCSTGENPYGFGEFDQGGVPSAVFGTASYSGRGMVYSGTPDGSRYWSLYNIESHSDVEMTGAFHFTEGASVDLVLRGDEGSGYRFGFDPSGSLRIIADGPGSTESDSPSFPPPEAGEWYRFHVASWERDGGVELAASIWPEGDEEPSRFQIVSVDTSAARIGSGYVGMSVAGTGEVLFDDFEVRLLPPSGSAVDCPMLAIWRHNDLSADSSYHYWVEVYDDSNAHSSLTGSVAGLPTAPAPEDTIPPADVTNLTASAGPGANEAVLRWTAVGDDSLDGRAASYDVRRYSEPLDQSNWNSATILSAGTPGVSGSTDTLLASSLTAGTTHYFALKTTDEAGNSSAISNSASVEFDQDVTPPVISGITPDNISSSSARIRWTLNEPADGEVAYGITPSYEIGTVNDPEADESHRLTIIGLTPNTLYYFEVRSTDEAGNSSSSGGHTFSTTVSSPATDPVITNLTVAALTDSDAVIDFNTNIPAVGRVDYGESVSYGGTITADGYNTEHSLRILSLDEGTAYHYRVRVEGEGGGSAVSPDQLFTTLEDETAPLIHGIAVNGVGLTLVTIVWSTDEPATSRVEYGITDSYGSFSEAKMSLTCGHEVTIPDLSPGTTYHFRVHSSDASENGAVSPGSTFVTTEADDGIAPLIEEIRVEEMTATTAVVFWQTSEPATGQVEYGADDSYGVSSPVNDSLQSSHRVKLSGLSGESVYHFRVLSSDEAGNEALSTDQVFTTAACPDTIAPHILSITLTEATDSAVTISWQTDEAATTSLEYGLSAEYGNSIAPSDILALSHEVRLEGLVPRQVYHFRIAAADSSGNSASSADSIFELTVIDSVPPSIFNVSLSDLTPSSARILWETDEPAGGFVEYGIDSAYGSTSNGETELSLVHSALLEDLSPGTLYLYRVTAADSSGNSAVSEEGSFTLEPVDDQGPAFLTVEVAVLSDESATIEWVTDEPSLGFIEWGAGTSLDFSTPIDTAALMEHTVRIAPLSSITSYSFRVVCVDSAGNGSTSDLYDFTTLALADTTPPRIGDVSLTHLGISSIRMSWTTNEPALGRVECGPDSAGPDTTIVGTLYLTEHSFDIHGLERDVVLHFRPAAVDTSGNESIGLLEETTLSPEGNPGIAIDGIILVDVGIRETLLSWESGAACESRVEYGTDNGYGTAVTDTALLYTHSVLLSDLEPETRYDYRVICRAGEESLTVDDLFFVTLPDTVPPAPEVTFVGTEYVDRHLAVILWSTDRAAAGRILVGREGYSLAPASSMPFVYSTAHSDTLYDLESNTLYYYTIEGISEEGVPFTSSIDSFRTAAEPVPPIAPFLVAAGETYQGVRLQWECDSTATGDTLVLYRRLLPGGSWNAIWSTTSLELIFTDDMQGVDLSGMQKAQYYFEAKDFYGNISTSDTVEVEFSLLAPRSPERAILHPNYPNPFNPATTIPFELPENLSTGTYVKVSIYNIKGEVVRILHNATVSSGGYREVTWDGTDHVGNPAGSGAFFCRLDIGTQSETRRMTLIR